MINTLADLRTYILEELGWPQLNVELTDNQLNHCIEKSVQQFANFSYDGELTKYIKFDCQGRGVYNVSDEIEEILQLNQSGLFYSGYDMNGYVDQNLSNYILNTSGTALSYLVTLSATRSLTQKYFGNSVNFEFNSHKGTLTVFQDFVGPLLIEAKFRYVPNEKDKIYNHEWVKKMAVAQARLMQSTIVGKYNQNLVGGAQVNYSDMRSLAESEIEVLNEELINRWVEPAPVLIV